MGDFVDSSDDEDDLNDHYCNDDYFSECYDCGLEVDDLDGDVVWDLGLALSGGVHGAG